MQHVISVSSLFAGVGGIDLGFEQAGCTAIWANELDPDACRTYRLNHPGTVLREGDIYAIPSEEFPQCDILTAGFPCQAFSIAGYRKGFEDARGVLFYQVMRYVDAVRPKAVFCENVKNLVTHDGGNTYRTIKSLLNDSGYTVYDKVLNSDGFGVPQNRERIYIAAFRNDIDPGTFSFPEPTPLSVPIHSCIDHSQQDPKYYYLPTHQYYPALDSAMKNPDTVYQWRRVYCRENQSNECPTLTANMGTGGHNVPLIRDATGIRKLTPRECFRFQGFPEDFKLPPIADSKLYKQAGNSVTVPVIRAIAENMVSVFGNVPTGPVSQDI